MSVERLILGSAQLGLPYGIAGEGRLLDTRQVERILERAVEFGIQALDCAPSYGCAESRVGEFLRGRGGERPFELHTKLAVLPRGAASTDLHEHVESALSGSLERLGVDSVELYLVHEAGDLRVHGAALIDALLEQVRGGRVQALGVSVYGPQDLQLALEHPELQVVQGPVNLLDQRLLRDPRWAELRANGVSLHARSAFLQGLFALDPDSPRLPGREARRALARLGTLLADWDLTPLEAALPFVLDAGVERVLIGVDGVDQLGASVTAAKRSLPAGLGDALLEAFSEVSPSVIDPRTW